MTSTVRFLGCWIAWSVLVLAAPADLEVARAGSAAILHDPATGTWTVDANGASLVLRFDPARSAQIVRLASPAGRTWTVGTTPDALVNVGGQSRPLGDQAAGFSYRNVSTSTRDQTVQLDATFDLTSQHLRVTRHYAATNGSPTFEVWTSFTPLSGTVTVADLNAFHLTVPAGTMRWVNGLQGDTADAQHDSAFARRQQDLRGGETLVLGAQGRSSEQTVPWIAIDGPGEEFYAGLMWSGAWSLSAARSTDAIDLTLGLASMSTKLLSTVDGPHAFFGVAAGGPAEAAASLRPFLVNGVRGGRPLRPLVTYNTWFAYGVDVDEASMRQEIDGAARLGAEVFVVDAGWYAGAGRGGASDFSSGLGTWRVDTNRFPRGLADLTEYAHARGLKFGIWVEPERVALSTIGQSGLAQETWLAKSAGKYGAADSAQICLGSAAARQWVLDRVSRLIDEVRPDYLKWDNNLWVNCDRSGHVHGTTDGNWTHVTALYDLLSTLRERYPDLLIENVSGGGNRLDFGMLRYSDVAWMDDRSAPSVVVRRNIQGLSAVFPPAYLLSFAMNGEGEPLHDAPDLALFVRSRMPAVLGLCFRTAELNFWDSFRMAREIKLYKDAREKTRDATGALLSAQASAVAGPEWDVMQTHAAADQPVVVWAFQSSRDAPDTLVTPTNLVPDTIYDVRTLDGQRLGYSRGSALMTGGIALRASSVSAAHVLVLTPTSR